MVWKRQVYYWGVAGAMGFCVGQGAVVMWPEWSAWTWWTLAAACVPLFVVPTIYDRRDRILAVLHAPSWTNLRLYGRTFWREILGLMTFVLAVAVLIGLFINIFTRERPSFVWAHPTATASDREKAAAECEMAAYEAIGGGRGGMMDPKPGERWRYKMACMTTRGFNLVQVKADAKVPD